MIIRLEQHNKRLRGIYFIEGIGLSSNIYVIGKNRITLIDTGVGNEVNRIAPQFEALGLKLKNVHQVILTHAHPDHFGGLPEILRHASPRVMVHLDDIEALAPYEEFTGLKGGDIVTTDILPLKVIHTPGHTAGSICLYNSESKVLFSGDTVFPNGSFGRTDMPTSDSQAIVNSLKELTRLDVDVLLPGHKHPVLERAYSHVALSLENARAML